MKLTVTIDGYQQGDLELALREVESKVAQGYKSGFNSNDTGSFRFDIEGQEVEKWVIASNAEIGSSIEGREVMDERFGNLDEAQEFCKEYPPNGFFVYGISNNGIALVKIPG